MIAGPPAEPSAATKDGKRVLVDQAGMAYGMSGEVGKARATFEKAVAEDPDYPLYYYNLACADAEENKLADARLHLQQAFARKADYDDAIHAAREAIQLRPNNAEAHFWLAESLRQKSSCAEAETQYTDYLTLSNFDSGMAGKLNYYLAGYLFGAGSKKRAAQTDIWKVVRGQANTGLCDCEWMEKKFDSAIRYCQVALTYTPGDLFTNYRLGIVYAQEYNQSGNVAQLAAARKHFEDVIQENPDANEADRSRKYVQNIDTVLAQQP